MEWLRDWIMQVAGIIVLGAICDMIMTDGAMKKYVKVVIGLVLVFVVIKPIANISPGKMDLISVKSSQTKAAEMKNRLDEKEKELVFRLYREKLQNNIQNYIYTQWKYDTDVRVTVEENDEKQFGDIKLIRIRTDKDESMDSATIKKDLSKEFGIKPENVKIDRF